MLLKQNGHHLTKKLLKLYNKKIANKLITLIISTEQIKIKTASQSKSTQEKIRKLFLKGEKSRKNLKSSRKLSKFFLTFFKGHRSDFKFPKIPFQTFFYAITIL